MGKFAAKYRKIIIGIFTILIYLTILTLVSFSRSTEIKVIGENLVNYQEFYAAGPEEGKAWVDDAGLHIRDAESGAKVFCHNISLRDIQQIQVRFYVECPVDFTGEATLHIDLFADGYDTDEQEFTVSLHAGKNEVSGIIDKGNSAPEEAQLRIFCLDAVECEISGLSIQTVVEIPRSGKTACVTALIVLIVCLLALLALGETALLDINIISIRKRIWGDIKKSNFAEKVLFLLSGVVLFVLCRYIFTEGNTWMHSDSASVVTLANEMVQTGQMFPDGWYYVTGISLLPFPVCVFLMAGVDFLLAHDMAQLLFTVLMLISIIMFSIKFLHNNSWLLVVPLLFTEISVVQYEMFFIQSAYASSVFIMFFSLVCFITANVTEPSLHVRKRKIPLFLIFFIFSALLGSVFLQQVTLPLCAAVIICGIIDHAMIPCIQDIKEYAWSSAIVLFTSIAGCVIYAWLCSKIYISGNPGLTTFRGSYREFIENISITLQALFYNMGLSGNVSLFSLSGIQNILRLILTIASWLVFPILAFRDLKNEPKQIQIFLLFSLIHILEVLILLLFCNSTDYVANARYQLTSLVLLTVISCNYVYEQYIKNFCRISVVYSFSIFIISGSLTILVANISGWQESISAMRGVTDFLSEQGLHYGYATFWNAGKNTVLSNGTVQINAVTVGTNMVTPYRSLSSEDWYDPGYFEGRTFLMLTEDEAAVFASNGYDYTNLYTPETVLNYSPYTILVYDHNISRNNFNDLLSGEANLVEKAACSDATMRQANGDIIIQEGQIMYGPYMPLNAGEYNLVVDISLVSPVDLTITAADAGGVPLGICDLTPDKKKFQFKLEEYHSQIEFVIRNQTSQTIRVSGLYLSSVSNGGGT